MKVLFSYQAFPGQQNKLRHTGIITIFSVIWMAVLLVGCFVADILSNNLFVALLSVWLNPLLCFLIRLCELT